jgi:hypothetical protein
VTETPATTQPESAATVRCPECGEDVPALQFCVRCGEALTVRRGTGPLGRRAQFAAQSDERVVAVHVLSTLFPQLPRADLATFRIVLAIGVLTLVGLSVLGLFPLALVAAELFVPLTMFLYLWDVDVYEDEPIRVLVFTAAWGIIGGVIVGLAIRLLLPQGSSLLSGPTATGLLSRSVVVPLVGGAIMLAGPLVLLPYRKFNDVLDGATFGATTAVTFMAAQGLSQAADIFSSGLRPAGDPMPWIVRLLSLGVASPLIAAGVIGATAGAFWLRWRAPVRDRDRLGLVGRPWVAAAGAAVVLVAAAAGQQLLPFVPALIWLSLLAIVSLIWLRAVIHLGLLEEASEIPIGPPSVCPNCGRTTPTHSFCGHCGTSLRASPNGPSGSPTALLRPERRA